jgi:fatty-acyl-CoA synthase
VFYDSVVTHGQFRQQTEWLAGWLQQVAGVQRGDRVLLCTQNSPQFAIGAYGVLRADAVLVPVNPMNRTEEIRHLVQDAGAKVLICAQDLFDQVAPLLEEGRRTGEGLQHVLVAAYSDHLTAPTSMRVPDFVAAPRRQIHTEGAALWSDALAQHREPAPLQGGPDDLAVMPYTSGTTGKPKGCMHTHRSVMYGTVARSVWLGSSPDAVILATLPYFHVTGFQSSLNSVLHLGATVVILPRWDRDVALECLQRQHITAAQMISTMVVDLLAHPGIETADLSSLQSIGGGGAAMPEAVAARLKALTGLDYIEGYGLSETMAATHINPVPRPKKQCLGIPIFDVDSRVVNPETFEEMPTGEVGEVLIHGPQLMQGYWRNDAANAEAFVTLGGKRFLRTGDLARVDEDGYFHMVDRLKRMINASGFKVWPSEVEALLYAHPAIQEACVIGTRDERRGETVKAIVVLKPEARGQVSEADIVDWAHTNMAAYKAPRMVTFAEHLPKSATGKILWRDLQAAETR